MYHVLGADGREYGPASASEVRLWLSQGRVHSQSMVRGPSGNAWQPLTSFPELLPPPPAFTPTPVPRPQSNAMAGWGCALGALSLGCCCCGFPFNVLAVIFSSLGLRQANQDHDASARTMAIIGLICGSLSLLGTLLLPFVSLWNALINH